MSQREELLKAGIPETVTDEQRVERVQNLDDVERDIAFASSTKIKITALENGLLRFEPLLGERRYVVVHAPRLWNPQHGEPLGQQRLAERLRYLTERPQPNRDEEWSGDVLAVYPDGTLSHLSLGGVALSPGDVHPGRDELVLERYDTEAGPRVEGKQLVVAYFVLE